VQFIPQIEGRGKRALSMACLQSYTRRWRKSLTRKQPTELKIARIHETPEIRPPNGKDLKAWGSRGWRCGSSIESLASRHEALSLKPELPPKGWESKCLTEGQQKCSWRAAGNEDIKSGEKKLKTHLKSRWQAKSGQKMERRSGERCEEEGTRLGLAPTHNRKRWKQNKYLSVD
jgi:hypothetical protein